MSTPVGSRRRSRPSSTKRNSSTPAKDETPKRGRPIKMVHPAPENRVLNPDPLSLIGTDRENELPMDIAPDIPEETHQELNGNAAFAEMNTNENVMNEQLQPPPPEIHPEEKNSSVGAANIPVNPIAEDMRVHSVNQELNSEWRIPSPLIKLKENMNPLNYWNPQRPFNPPTDNMIPTEILLQSANNLLGPQVCETAKEVIDKKSFEGLFIWDNGESSIEAFSKRILSKYLKGFKINWLAMKQFDLKCDEWKYHDQVRGIVDQIEKTIASCGEKEQCLLFIDRIDTLWESVAWHEYGRVKVANTLKKLKLYPIFLLATAGKDLNEIQHVDGLRNLFINPDRITKLPRPNREDMMRLFMPVFKRRPEFKKAFNDYRDGKKQPIYDYDLGILRKCFGDEFGGLMDNLFEMCHGQTLMGILDVHGRLFYINSKYKEKDFKTAMLEIAAYFRQVVKERIEPNLQLLPV